MFIFALRDETADLFNIIKQIGNNIPVDVIDQGFEKQITKDFKII